MRGQHAARGTAAKANARTLGQPEFADCLPPAYDAMRDGVTLGSHSALLSHGRAGFAGTP
jgi:hypothetical protein